MNTTTSNNWHYIANKLDKIPQYILEDTSTLCMSVDLFGRWGNPKKITFFYPVFGFNEDTDIVVLRGNDDEVLTYLKLAGIEVKPLTDLMYQTIVDKLDKPKDKYYLLDKKKKREKLHGANSGTMFEDLFK